MDSEVFMYIIVVQQVTVYLQSVIECEEEEYWKVNFIQQQADYYSVLHKWTKSLHTIADDET